METESYQSQHVFLVGAKSMGTYGGYETFINKLTEYHRTNQKIQYHVACKANGDGSMDPCKAQGAQVISEREFIYHNAHCFRIRVPQWLGAAQAVYYDVAALLECCRIIKNLRIPHPVVYIMACRIGPFAKYFYRKIHKLGGRVFLNPDGHEWMRRKWSVPVRRYWKFSEWMMVRNCDLVICDSVSIEKYIYEYYGGRGKDPRTTFIAYGAETRKSKVPDEDPGLRKWYRERGLSVKGYYLLVGRFVPENNYEIMIREFMKSHSEKDMAVITNVNGSFMEELERKLHFREDGRIKFVGTVYDQEMLMKIRENAYGYIHGHEVGGTNPSLLEALGSTDLNLLLDARFNQEVAGDAAVYWNKEEGNLAGLIDWADKAGAKQAAEYGRKAKRRIEEAYSWREISKRYEEVFLK